MVRDAYRTSRNLVTPQERANQIAALFDPRKVEDQRRVVTAQVRVRQGQGLFRKELLEAYGGRCAMTGYDAVDAVEAAHIVSYRGPVTNHPSNGLLLRADMHSLFDLGLVAIDAEDPADLRIIVDRDLKATAYAKFEGTRLRTPSDPALCPSTEALRVHRDLSGI